MAANAAKKQMVHKHVRMDAVKIRRLKKVMNAKTDTEVLSRAVDIALSEYDKNRIVLKATKEFLQSGIEIQDVLGALEPGVLSNVRSS